jgi:hypothetical protein
MRTYNRALDFMALAMDQHARGRVKTAAKFFMQASQSSDLKAAIAIIEASNAQAYTAKVKAEAKTKTVQASAENKALAALGADEDELCAEVEPEGEPETVEDEAIGEEDKEDDSMSFANALASLTKPAKK